MNRAEYYESVQNKYNISDKKRNFIVIGSPNHGNLGDIAITYATLKLLERLYPDDNVFDINMSEFPVEIDAIYHLIKPQDVLVLQGGGNFGHVYPDDEMIRRYIILRFRSNKIIMFPQSVWYSDDLNGEKELVAASQLYGQRKNLLFLARDKYSYGIFKKYFNVSSKQLSDVVLTQKTAGNFAKEGVLLCFRKDKEGLLKENDKKKVLEAVKNLYDKVKITDTVVEFDGNKSERDGRLIEKLEEFQRAELVVTDRLHGMVFSIITNTPCIVFPTKGNKITSAFESLNNIKGIYLVKSEEAFERVLLKIKDVFGDNYNNESLIQEYANILSDFLESPCICEENTGEGVDNIFSIASYWDYKAYESEYWLRSIKEDYDKLHKNNEERIKELSDYKEWNENLQAANREIQESYRTLEKNYVDRTTEIQSYKEWVNNLETQKAEAVAAYESLNKNLDERIEELKNYKNWVSNLETQCDELQTSLQEINSAYKSIEICCENQKLQINQLSDVIAGKDEQQMLLENTIKKLKDREAIKQRQIDIQLSELYNNVKKEREEKLRCIAEWEEKNNNIEIEKNDLVNQLNVLYSELENTKKKKHNAVYKTLRCLKLYGVKHTIRECKAALKGK